ncbi:MAG: hypothetical protein WKF92_05640 [Pyrinomonadaceae bacterium]
MNVLARFQKLKLTAWLLFLLTAAGFAQDGAKEVLKGEPVLWEAVSIAERDLQLGPGGRELFPNLKGLKFVGRQPGGNNLKFRLKEESGREWVVKAADESQPEVAAVRLLAIGYPTKVDYIVPKLSIEKLGKYKNVRFEARPEDVKRGGRWSWDQNPFKDAPEFAGLRIMMAMFNNWDLKDENTVILQKGDKLYYAVSDLGSSFGKLAKNSKTRSGRSVNKPEHYADTILIKDVDGGKINFAYSGQRSDLMNGIKVEHGRWLADLLLQLSDKQIEDAFRAANYSAEDVQLLASAFKVRIAELGTTTRPASL